MWATTMNLSRLYWGADGSPGQPDFTALACWAKWAMIGALGLLACALFLGAFAHRRGLYPAHGPDGRNHPPAAPLERPAYRRATTPLSADRPEPGSTTWRPCCSCRAYLVHLDSPPVRPWRRTFRLWERFSSAWYLSVPALALRPLPRPSTMRGTMMPAVLFVPLNLQLTTKGIWWLLSGRAFAGSMWAYQGS